MQNSKHLKQNDRLVIIGASTGGPVDIKKIIRSLSDDFRATIVIAQHMGNDFIKSFASHISEITHVDVKVAENNEYLLTHTIYIASEHCQIIKGNNGFVFHITSGSHQLYNPDINVLFRSCASFAGSVDILACILTGIGDDGAKGMSALCQAQARCITANRASSAVYGMPLRAQEVSKAVKALSLNEIITQIKGFTE